MLTNSEGESLGCRYGRGIFLKKLIFVLFFALATVACSSSSNTSGAPVPPVPEKPTDNPSACNNDGVNGDDYLAGNGIVSGQKLGQNNAISSRVVLIYNSDKHKAFICTGSLLPGNVVLTAGHCVSRAKEMTIVFNNNLNCARTMGGQTFFAEYGRQVTEFVQHPKYASPLNDESGDTNYDLAMIHFEGSLYPGFTTFEFPKADFRVAKTDTLIMSGYGVTGYENADSAGVLRITKTSGAKLSYMSTNPEAPQNLMIDQKLTGVCSGDSGSGLLVQKNGRLEIIGVTSTVNWNGATPKGSQCSEKASFVDLSLHQSWLSETYDRLRR